MKINKQALFFTLFIIISVYCWAGGNKEKETVPQPAQPAAQLYWTGDGGKGRSIAILSPRAIGLVENQNYIPDLVQGEFVSNFTSFSAISVLDRLNLDAQYAELLSGYYADDAKATLDLGHLPPTDYIMGGSITRTDTGYALQMWISKTDDKMTVASYSGTCTFAELDNLTGIRRASLDLLQKIGVKPTEQTRIALTEAATRNHVNAQTALAQGIVAQRQGTEIVALSYFFQAEAFDPSLKEATSRSTVISTNISSGNIGDDVRNEIQQYRNDLQLRQDWIDRLTEIEKSFYTMFNSIDPPYTLFYSTGIERGAIDFQKETVNLSIPINLRSNGFWFLSIQQAINTVYRELLRTKRSYDWGLSDWPQKGASDRNPFNPFTIPYHFNFNIVFELVNEQNIVIGRQTVYLRQSFHFSRELASQKINYAEHNFDAVTFSAIKANDISGILTIRIASINGSAPENAHLPITALSDSTWQAFYNQRYLRISNGVIFGFRQGEKLPDKNVLVLPDIVWDEHITAIGNEAFKNNGLSSLIIPNSVTRIGEAAFEGNRLTSIIIGSNVNIGYYHDRNQGWSYFREFYQKTGRRAGTYTWDGRRWNYSRQ